MHCRLRAGIEVQLHSFLTSALDGVGGQNQTPGKEPGTHGTGGWVSPRASLDWCGKQNISWIKRGSVPEPSTL